jgi:hypothetical protein
MDAAIWRPLPTPGPGVCVRGSSCGARFVRVVNRQGRHTPAHTPRSSSHALQQLTRLAAAHTARPSGAVHALSCHTKPPRPAAAACCLPAPAQPQLTIAQEEAGPAAVWQPQLVARAREPHGLKLQRRQSAAWQGQGQGQGQGNSGKAGQGTRETRRDC